MKISRHIFCLFSLIFLFISCSNSQNIVSEIEVHGNCGMCKERIEKAARIKGVQKANWNVKTKMLNVSFDSTKTTLYSIQKSIAAVGHDTREVKASDESYNALHGCCQYERKAFKE